MPIQKDLEEATRTSAPNRTRRGQTISHRHTNNDPPRFWHKSPTTNIFFEVHALPRICSSKLLLQTCSYKHAPTNMLPQTCSHKHASTNMLPQTASYNITAQCMSSRLNIYQAIHSPTHTHGLRHTFSTYIQSKVNILLHTYRAKHTFNHMHTEQGILSTTHILLWRYAWRRGPSANILPQTCCHKHVGQDILFPTTTSYQSHWSRHTSNYGHLLGNILLPYTSLIHTYRSLT